MICKIPYTDGEHTDCANAPDKIVEQLEHIWSNSKGDKFRLPKVIEGSIENVPLAKVYLGGDHTITYYTVKEFVKRFPHTGFIVFDAHPDVFQAFDNPSHQDYLKFLIEEGLLKPEQVFVVGIRASHPEEISYYKEKGIKYYPCRSFFSCSDTAEALMEQLLQFDAVYLSIDIDVVDPAYAPGVSYVEPCGLTSRELFYFVQRLKKLPNLKTMDLVEVSPKNDVNSMTTKLAAKLVAEFLSTTLYT
jgi:arginase family enzyme